MDGARFGRDKGARSIGMLCRRIELVVALDGDQGLRMELAELRIREAVAQRCLDELVAELEAISEPRTHDPPALDGGAQRVFHTPRRQLAHRRELLEGEHPTEHR